MNHRYSTIHRTLEIIGLGVFVCFFVLLSGKTIQSLLEISDKVSITVLILTPIIAYLSADFISGFVHFLCDNFGSPETPLIGSTFIQPFREHHDDPQGITRHDFIEVNTNTCLAGIPVLLAFYFFLPLRSSAFALHIAVFILFFILFVTLTNQFHKWAHQSKPPAAICRLQQMNLILSPKHHDLHHTPPFDKYYCITSGWLNPVLAKIGFFEFFEKLIRQFNHLKDAYQKH